MSVHASRFVVIVLLAAAPLACGGATRPSVPSAPQPATAGALARFAPEPVMVVPTTVIAGGDSAGWRTAAGGEMAVRAMADSALERAFRGRGLSPWIYPPAVLRAARRNPTYLADPAAMRPAFGIRAAMRSLERTVSEPLASQLRGLASASSATAARYTLVPTDLDLLPTGSQLTVALVDVRLAQLLWVGTVTGERRTAWDPSLLTDLMDRVADLVVPR